MEHQYRDEYRNRERDQVLTVVYNTLHDIQRYIVDILLAIALFILFIMLRYSITFIIVNIINMI